MKVLMPSFLLISPTPDMHMLPDTVEKVEGAPNFRQVTGFLTE